MTATATAQPKAQEQAQQKPKEEKRQYKRRQPDNTPPGVLMTAVKNYGKFYRAGNPQKADECRKEAEEARKQITQTTDPAQQDELMKRIRLAENRAARTIERASATRHQEREALKEVIAEAQSQLDAIPADLDDTEKGK